MTYSKELLAGLALLGFLGGAPSALAQEKTSGSEMSIGYSNKLYMNSDALVNGATVSMGFDDAIGFSPVWGQFTVQGNDDIRTVSVGALVAPFSYYLDEPNIYRVGGAVEFMKIDNDSDLSDRALDRTVALVLKNELEAKLGRRVTVGAHFDLDLTTWMHTGEMGNTNAFKAYEVSYRKKKPDALGDEVKAAFREDVKATSKTGAGLSVKVRLGY